MPREIGKNFCRFRIASPSKFDKRSIRTVTPNKNTRVIVGCRKGEWSRKSGKCRGSMQTQAVLKRKVSGRCPR